MVKTLAGASTPHVSAGFIDEIPAEAALIDWRGVIIAINDRWQQHAREEVGGPGGGNELGRNYLDAWRRRAESIGDDAIRIAERLERLLKNEIAEFSLLFARPTASRYQWYRIVASQPSGGSGAVILLFAVDPGTIRADLDTVYRHGDGVTLPTAVDQLAPPSRGQTGISPPADAESEHLFETLLPLYQSLLWDNLFRPDQGGAEAADRRAEAIGRQLAAAGADAGFVLRLHIDALRQLRSQLDGGKSKWLSSESRIVFISVLGFLTNYYRDALRGEAAVVRQRAPVGC